MISRGEVGEYCKGRQQTYAAARVLSPQFLNGLRTGKEQVKGHLGDVLSTLLPFLPGEVRYEVCLIDDCNVAETTPVDDGGQLILVNRHFLSFLRNFIELVARGIRFDEDGNALAKMSMSDEEKSLFGRGLGEYLNFGAQLSFPTRESSELGPEIYIATIEFVLAHEIVHRIEGDLPGDDLDLDGFQDFCRLRGRESRCDRRAVALVLERRKQLDLPEMALLGAVCALTAMSWIEQFTPGHVPTSWHHPSSDSRVLRVLLEGPLFWRAAGLEGQPSEIASAALRRAFRFLAALEDNPKLIASPMNDLIRHCIRNGEPDHEFFEARIGEAFAQGRTDHVALSLGVMWGSAEKMAAAERSGHFDPPVGQLAAILFRRLHDRLATAGAASRDVAGRIKQAKEHHLASPES